MKDLRDPFDKTFDKGGFTYVSWSQVADRLDESGEQWSFAIIALGPDWAHGRLTLGDRHFENIGYAENAEAEWKKEPYKDAASDAFKRCAALAGVARYLYDKDAPSHSTKGTGRVAPSARPAARTSTVIPEFPDDFGPPPESNGTAAQDSLDQAWNAGPRPEGRGWTFKELAAAAEEAGVPKNRIYATADQLFGKGTKVTDLSGAQREQIAFEMGLVA